ncbi:hypothetical protein [Pantoea agglomerans]|uniref:Uncharacterized protein n=1 Tax=Enterobacter agglomerans TaxID=549 RepID=A0ACC5RMM3_ENTAG|nr:hypothetical protein [Pantoea agglomerans]MBK4725732.1 hypothetical protein [Pantoea agglomerans]
MAKKHRTGGLIQRKEDNFHSAIFAGGWQGEIDDFWREPLQNSLIKVMSQPLMLFFGELITSYRDFQLVASGSDGLADKYILSAVDKRFRK